MVDKERRKKLAFHLRQLSVGLTTNDEFEGNVLDDVTNGWLPEQYYRSKEAKSDDPVIQPVLELCWCLYDDTRRHKLVRSDKLSDKDIRIIARWILFLRSDKEYKWSYYSVQNPLFRFSLMEIVFSILTLGHYYRNKREEQIILYYEWQKLGDFEVWPFLKKSDYEQQLTCPPFLAGHS